MRYKPLLLILVLLLLFGVVNATPPHASAPNVGLYLKFPDLDVIPKNTTTDFAFHAVSLETGLAINNSMNCTFHLYNNTGEHIHTASSNVFTHTFDIEFMVKGGNFSDVGQYSYWVYCKCFDCAVTAGLSDLGGSVTAPISVTEFGSEKISGDKLGIIALVFLGVLFLLVYMYSNMDEVHYPIKIFFQLLVWVLIPALFGVVAMIIKISYGSGSYHLYTFFEKMFGYFTIVTYIMFIYWFLAFIYFIYSLYVDAADEKDKEFEDSFGNLKKW